jgi:hypothetical protein
LACPTTYWSLHQLERLRTLELNETGITQEGFQAIAEHPTVTHFLLSYVNSGIAKAMQRQLWPELLSLTISKLNEPIQLVLETVQQMPKLQTLTCQCWNPYDPNGFSGFADANDLLLQQSCLTTLRLVDFLLLTTDTPAIAKMSKLTELDIGHCVIENLQFSLLPLSELKNLHTVHLPVRPYNLSFLRHLPLLRHLHFVPGAAVWTALSDHLKTFS